MGANYQKYLESEKSRIESEFHELQQNYEIIEERLKILQGSYEQVCKILDDLGFAKLGEEVE